MRNKILFVINGLGMGNSTRCYSIIQELHALGYDIDVATSNNGLLFFKDRPEVTNVYAIGSVHYGKTGSNKLAIARTLWLILTGLGTFFRNGIFLVKLIRRDRPVVVVYDSQYNLLPKILTRAPLVALNNADRIVSGFFQSKNKPKSIYAQFFFIELWDWVFHQLVPRFSLSPWVDRTSGAHVGLIVRRGIQPPPPVPTRIRRVLIMLSGSTFGGEIDPTHWNLPYEFDIIGREGKSTANVRFHGKLVDNIELLRQTDLLIINAGFSAVSEAIALRKPTVVIPVENHAEQWVNAQLLQNLGLGLVATHEDVREKLLLVIQSFDRFSANALEMSAATDGARECARMMQDLVRNLNGFKPRALNAMTRQQIPT